MSSAGLRCRTPERRNWFNLNALSRGEARDFLDQRLKLDEQMREKVLDEASEVDDLPGLVRPITLNMLGLVLQRYRGGTLEGAPPGRLIQSYLRQAMAKPGIDDLAPRLLGEMITDKGTKRPVDEADAGRAHGARARASSQGLLVARRGRRGAGARARAAGVGDQPRFRRASAQPDHPATPAVPLPAAQARLAPVALVAWLVLFRSWPSAARRSWNAMRATLAGGVCGYPGGMSWRLRGRLQFGEPRRLRSRPWLAALAPTDSHCADRERPQVD